MRLGSPVIRLTTIALALAAGLALTGCSNPSAADAPRVEGRSVQHVRGTTQVPADPRRVVTLEPLELDTAVALGVTPVGAAVASNVAGIPAYLGVGDAVASVGTVPEPDLEAIAALEPDLILGTESRHSELYDELRSIAPTVFVASQSDPWADDVALVAQALGRGDRAAELLDEHRRRCDRIAAEHALAGTTANFVRPRDAATLSLYGPTSFAGSVLECAGFTLPERDWGGGIQVDISPERVPEAAADHLFVPVQDVADPAGVPPLVANAPQVFGHVHLVDTSYWVSGVGPLGGERVLDDIDRILDAG
ncbi:ABC transporter substrate-binding protein [Kineococcus rhizosphaerae]|uniref:Iron complex transport system substrate-binding protein n=1 Tax=Kineococcus rhizosphaerae TaxID=559628 RepID=A0A2T0R691_9ACTN|nr:iron-siderophore ABC transporter substrate-binding protein [Kineococcus rhizosphaerae]PRY16673.1 iron complex transport system substrate-binding protein [Kineococcus rhizosphaerae]